MTLTADERKKLMGHGGLARAANLARRSRSHMTQLNQLLRRDERGERAIARVIIERNPNVDPTTIWPSVISNGLTQESAQRSGDDATDVNHDSTIATQGHHHEPANLATAGTDANRTRAVR